MNLECANCGAVFHPAGTPTKCDVLRLESLLRDNHPPTSVENSTISRLESSIDEYDRIIMSLQNQQMELKRRASRYASLLAPIRKIPPEVLLLILQIACLSNSLAKPAFKHQKRQLVTVNVGQVCNYWRNLVMSNEGLWSALGNLQIGDDGNDPELPLIIMQTYLSRSGSRPLTFTLNLGEGDISPTADRVAQCSSRWGDVTLSRVAREDWNIDPHSEGFPVLESLSINLYSFFLPLDTFKVAPHLHTLMLMDMEDCHVVPGPTDFPWGQLRYLELDSPSVAMCEKVLPLCTQLSRLHLDLPRSSHYVEPLVFNAASIKLPISSLSLTIYDEVAGSFFTSATLPALTSLKLTLSYIDKPKRTNLIPIQGIRSCLSRSQCTVTKVTIKSYNHLAIPDVVLVDYLRLFPAATHLALEGVTISGTFMEHLNPLICPSSNVLLPNLLTLEWLAGTSFNYETFVGLLKARWNPSMHDTMAQIRAVSLLNECERATFDPTLLLTLRVLNKSGMSITIDDGEGLVFGPGKC